MTSTARARLHHCARVRWAEVDAQGIVFNGHYLAYADVGATEYWRALALGYQRIPEMFGGELFVRHAEVSYHASARYDDWLDLAVRCEHIGRTSLKLHCRIEAQGRHVVDVHLIYVLADPQRSAAIEIPDALRSWISAYESGEDMVQVRIGAWSELQHLARPLRTAVFIDEQGVPPELEWDDDDATALHVVALNRAEQVLATARLLQPEPGVAKVGRMAVDAAVRRTDIGRRVLQTLIAQARARGDTRVELHAQLSAQGFYRHNGFAPVGDVFAEAGIDHVLMTLGLV